MGVRSPSSADSATIAGDIAISSLVAPSQPARLLVPV